MGHGSATYGSSSKSKTGALETQKKTPGVDFTISARPSHTPTNKQELEAFDQALADMPGARSQALKAQSLRETGAWRDYLELE